MIVMTDGIEQANGSEGFVNVKCKSQQTKSECGSGALIKLSLRDVICTIF